MVERKYRVCLTVPLGSRSGTMTVCEADGKIDGRLCVMNGENHFCGTASGNGQVILSGTLKTLISTVRYTATGTMGGRKILLNLKTESGAYYSVSGEELCTDE